MRFTFHLPLLLLFAALSLTEAHASDIQCATTRQPAERVICDHAILNNEYDDIVEQQKALLTSGKVSAAQIVQWRQARNACTDVHCVDTVFAQWKSVAQSVEGVAGTAQAPAVASATALAPVGPVSDAYGVASDTSAVPASSAAADATSEASLVRQGSAAGVALPQAVASQASPVEAASAAPGATGLGGSASLGILLIVLVIVAVALGAFLIRRSRNAPRK